MARYFLTTAIDYPNGPPHIGHSLEKIAADVVARYHRLRGDETFFCMGLDENSQNVLTAAEANGVPAGEWVDRMDEAFRLAWREVQCSYDRWIRTTEPVHFRASQELFRRAQAAGDIYKGSYSGYYCPNCNTFYSAEELTPQGTCPNHPTTTPDWLEEENYFFALSRYTEPLLRHVEANPGFIVPATWRGEILNLLRSGLRDFSVSRPVRSQRLVEGRPWGVPVPGDPEHVIYVWFDALTNYLTAAGFPDEPERFERTWPADAHVIGKDITRFHCLYWPAMLLSAGLPLPRSVAVHGFMTLDGQRISKTTGNIVDPVQVAQQYGADALRFYLMRDISFERDGDFTQANLIQRYNSDLANDLGNLLNRTVSMIGRYFEGVVQGPPAEGVAGGDERDAQLRRVAEEAGALTAAGIERWDFDGALDGTWTLVRRANQYIDENEPWKLARDPQQRGRLGGVLYGAAESLRLLGLYLAPVIPTAAARMREQLGLPALTPGAWHPQRGEARWGGLPPGTQVQRAQPIFPRIEVGSDATP
ncbi:MAG TPA: class I tRNA ligase family protein [Chloroflexota bacterium]|nr:class I tRNA ligase family protein [Chloroflexota bacterium]